ncbi:MAG: DUF4097 domain-containing protein, partial [Defluviitaleaceae bacterium]|nr:DUF4097 domain-containing protein [Defluviitaleaceae bacterium]
TIKRGSGDKLTVTYSKWMDCEYPIRVSNGELIINQDVAFLKSASESYDTGWFGDYLKSLGKDPVGALEITIPESMPLSGITIQTCCNISVQDCKISGELLTATCGTYSLANDAFGSVNIVTSSGEINADSCVSAGKFEASTASGPIALIDVSAGTLNLSTASGSINASNCKAATINAAASSGPLMVENCAAESQINVSTASGAIIASNCTSGKISAASASAPVTVENCAAGEIDAATTSGQIAVNDCAVKDLEIGTTSGGADVKLAEAAGNYDVTFSTITGKLYYNGAEAASWNALNSPGAANKISFGSASGSLSISDGQRKA